MGLLSRLQIVVATVVSVGVVAVIYGELQSILIEPAKNGGKHEGFLSDQIAQLDTLMPILLSFLLLGVVTWFIVATVQNERTQRVQKPPR